MRLIVNLMYILTAILLLTPASEGVKCYECGQCGKDPGETVECKTPCAEGVLTENDGPAVIARGCGTPGKDPASGCEPFKEASPEKKIQVKGDICGCNKDLCNLNLKSKTGQNKNGSCALSYQWMSVAASFLIAISRCIFRCQ